METELFSSTKKFTPVEAEVFNHKEKFFESKLKKTSDQFGNFMV